MDPIALGTEELQLPASFSWRGEHIAIELPGATAMFTTRRGGASHGPYATLNLGRLTGDDPADVTRNRITLQAQISAQLAMIRQVHGTRVITLTDRAEASGPLPQRDLTEADGQATAADKVAPIVLTADCLPIALSSGTAVAMLHAGWRGLAAGIVEVGMRALLELGASSRSVQAAIGPGAGGCCYEVGEEIHDRFRAFGSRVRHGRRLDLKMIARDQLEAAGVSTVHDVGLCTICSPPALFFSHRRDRGVTGRQAGLVWLS